MKSMSTALSVRLITRLGCWKVNRLELTVKTYVSPTVRPSNTKYPNELVNTLSGSSSELPVSTISALRIDVPSAVVTRPDMDACAAVGARNSSPHPPAISQVIATTLPPSSRTNSLHVPFAFVKPNVPNKVVSIGPPIMLPGSTYGPGGAGAGKFVTGDSHVVGSNLPVVSGPLSGST